MSQEVNPRGQVIPTVTDRNVSTKRFVTTRVTLDMFTSPTRYTAAETCPGILDSRFCGPRRNSERTVPAEYRAFAYTCLSRLFFPPVGTLLLVFFFFYTAPVFQELVGTSAVLYASIGSRADLAAAPMRRTWTSPKRNKLQIRSLLPRSRARA